jgi:hypothetical protein
VTLCKFEDRLYYLIWILQYGDLPVCVYRVFLSFVLYNGNLRKQVSSLNVANRYLLVGNGTPSREAVQHGLTQAFEGGDVISFKYYIFSN